MIPNMLYPRSTEPTAGWWVSPDHNPVPVDATRGLALPSSVALSMPHAVRA